MNPKEIPVLLLTGYLGSGKTTLVNHILSNQQGIRFAVIVNDIGEVNIDASLIRKEGIVGNKDKSLVALQNGCICCSLQSDLVVQMLELMQLNCFDYIVIEASGICEPEPIAQTLCSIPFMGGAYTQHGICRLDCIATVVDALRMQDEFGCGEALAEKPATEEDIRNLLIQQVEFCNLILLNKADKVSPEHLEHIREVLRALQPQAAILTCDHANVALDRLLHTGLFHYGATAASAGWAIEMAHTTCECGHTHDAHEHDAHEHDAHGHNHETHEHRYDEHGYCSCGHHHAHDKSHADTYGITTFVYTARPPFQTEKFDRFIAQQWPAGVIRTKGICYFSETPDLTCIFEQAGRQKQLTESGLWYATLPPDELERRKQQEPEMFREWDEVYGDRMQKLVFIGKDLDKETIIHQLDACLDKDCLITQP